jgi:FkbM family methyltransferase
VNQTQNQLFRLAQRIAGNLRIPWVTRLRDRRRPAPSWRRPHDGLSASLGVLTKPFLPLSARIRFLFQVPVDYVWPAERRSIPLPSAPIFLDGASLHVDREVFREIFVFEDYDCNYEGASVIDVGAYKGYFGVYALIHGARMIFSFEPDVKNFSTLAKTQAAARESNRWRLSQAAVGSQGGRTRLLLSSEPWAHSVVDLPTSGASRAVGEIDVPRVALSRVIDQAHAEGADRILVKIDAELSECDIILGTSVDHWRKVDTILFETHERMPCSEGEVILHLERAGLRLETKSWDVVKCQRVATPRP